MKSLPASEKSTAKPSQQHQRTTPFFSGNSHQEQESPFFSRNTHKESLFFEETVQAKAMNNRVCPNPDSNIRTKNETGMPIALKSGLESLSGEDLSGVRIHRNSSKPETIQANAFTQGQNIHLAPGQEKHLPHEGWHVVQQMQGRVAPTIQQKNALINDDASLEKEADVMGERAIQMKSKDSPNKIKNTANSTNSSNGVIQRAMKFEYQLKKNRLYRDTGSEVHALPRKFGPRDYILRFPSGARLESETGGQIEFETSWEKKWPKLRQQINTMQAAAYLMKISPNVTGSNGQTYKKFPFSVALDHLGPNSGFPTTSTGRWNKTQKEGKAKVLNPSDTKENFRSTKSYASDDNILQTINNGEKVFVNYYSSDRKWAKIKYNGKFGWIWNKSLTGVESKYYEDNKDNRKVRSDKPLQGGEKLLVKQGDSDWKPYVQISESFKLEQYESYLKQYDKKLGPSLISGTRKYLLEQNSEKAPSGESLVQRMVREWKFLFEHNKLKNLLLMVGHYIEKGRTQTTLHGVRQDDGSIKQEPGSAKYALSLLNRTHFGSIFKSMSKKEKALFTQMVYDKNSGIIKTMGLTNSSKMFMDGTSTGYNPTVYSWLISITRGGDNLSVQSGNKLPAAMGRFNINEEKGKHEGLVRLEARNEPDNFPKLLEWDDHALRHFEAAIGKRPRDTDNDKTGLKK